MLARAIPFALSLGAAVAAMSLPVDARATPSKQQCVDDNAEAQELRRQGHFAEAGDRLQRCAAPSCPELVRDDCTRRLDDLKKSQPSLVFEVRSTSGMDVISVRVSVDGHLFSDHLDGTPLNVDPGPHTFTFEAPDQPPASVRLLIREGETARHERIVMGAGPPPTASAIATAPGPQAESPSTAAPDRRTGARQIVGLSAAGLGVAGAAVGVVFGMKARSAWSAAKTACGGDPSHCTDVPDGNSHRSQAVTDGAVSTVAFVAGAAMIVGGGFLYVTGNQRHEGQRDAIAISGTVEPGRWGVVLSGAFR